MDKLNADGNLIGRLGALVVIAVVVVGLGRVCGVGEMCPLSSTGKCCLFTKVAAQAPASPAAAKK